MIEPYYFCGPDLKCWIDWVYRWQTIIAGFGAFVGAVVTVCAIKKQIAQADKHLRQSETRQLERMKGRAHYFSSELITHTEKVTSTLLEVRSNLIPNAAVTMSFDLVKISESIEALTKEICDLLALESEENSSKLAKLVSKIQIHHSRFRGILEEYRPNTSRVFAPNEIDTHIIAWAAIRDACEKLLLYVRDQRDAVLLPNSTDVAKILDYDIRRGDMLVNNDDRRPDMITRELDSWSLH